jgi:VWFA-related protein
MKIRWLGRRRVVVIGGLVTAAMLSVRPHAQQRPSPEGPDYLTLDFRAIGSDGRLVTDLTEKDIAIRIDGRARGLRSLQLVTVGDGATTDTAPAVVLPPPFASSRVTGGRSLILVVDDDSLRPGREARLREAVNVFVAGLGRRDQISLVTMPYGGVKVPFTDDHARIDRALLMMSGQASQNETGSEMACRTRRVLESLVGLLGTVAGTDGPVTVMFFSVALAGPRRDAPVMMAPGMCELTKDHFEAVGAAAAKARANFYVIQPEDLMQVGAAQTENIAGAGFTGSDNPLLGLENLAGVTGGERIHLATTPTALRRVLYETSSYYVASLEPMASDRPGTRHTLDVRVARDRVAIRARPAIQFDKNEPGAARARANAREMLRVTDTYGALAIRTAGYVSRNAPDGTTKVVFLAEPVDPTVRLASAAAALVAADGRLVAQWSADDPTVSPLMGAMQAPPGTYRMRVAATDTSGRGGTADYEVVAALTDAGSLKLSSVVLGLSRDGGFSPRLQFGAEPVALGSLEIYGGSPGARVSAILEVAATMNGPALVTVPLAIAPGGADRYIATGAIPIGALPPGDYVVRAIVGIEGQPAGRVVRTLRKSLDGR